MEQGEEDWTSVGVCIQCGDSVADLGHRGYFHICDHSKCCTDNEGNQIVKVMLLKSKDLEQKGDTPKLFNCGTGEMGTLWWTKDPFVCVGCGHEVMWLSEEGEYAHFSDSSTLCSTEYSMRVVRKSEWLRWSEWISGEEKMSRKKVLCTTCNRAVQWNPKLWSYTHMEDGSKVCQEYGVPRIYLSDEESEKEQSRGILGELEELRKKVNHLVMEKERLERREREWKGKCGQLAQELESFLRDMGKE